MIGKQTVKCSYPRTHPRLLFLSRHVAGEDPSRVRELRINCPDATGLGVDVFRVLLDFGLRILKADITTDGTWCLLILTVSLSHGVPPRWQLLSARLLDVCPTDIDSLRLLCPSTPKQSTPYAVHVSGYDRQGMLHSLAHALWEADTAVFKAHVTTDGVSGQIRDTFWLYDNRDELPQPHRVLEICDRVKGALGPDVHCDIEPAPLAAMTVAGGSAPTLMQSRSSGHSLQRMACKDTASCANLRSIVGRKKEACISGAASSGSYATSYAASSSGESDCGAPSPPYTHSRSHSCIPSDVQVEVDTVASASHTLFTLHCKDRKGLLYDLFLNLKEVDVRVAFGKVDVDPDTEECTADLYVQDSEFERIEDEELVEELVQRLQAAAALPVRIEVQSVNEGAATELTVSAHVDVGGRGRPRVTYDVTQGLCAAGLGVACADIYVEEAEPPSPSVPGATEEIHRFVVHMPQGGGLGTPQDRDALIDMVRASLLGIRAPQSSSTKLASTSADALSAMHLGGGSVTLALHSGDESGSSPGGPILLRSLSEAWKGS